MKIMLTVDIDNSVPCLDLSVIECSLGIICVSIPALRPLAARLYPKGFRSSLSSTARSLPHIALSNKRSSRSSNNTELEFEDRTSHGPHLEHGRLEDTRREQAATVESPQADA